MSASKTLMTGESNEIGRYDLDLSAGLFGLSSGIILLTFQMPGKVEVCIHKLKSVVIYLMAMGPKCLIIIGERLSGPKAFELLVLLIAWSTVSGVKVISSSSCLRCFIFLTDLS